MTQEEITTRFWENMTENMKSAENSHKCEFAIKWLKKKGYWDKELLRDFYNNFKKSANVPKRVQSLVHNICINACVRVYNDNYNIIKNER